MAKTKENRYKLLNIKILTDLQGDFKSIIATNQLKYDSYTICSVHSISK